MKPCLSRSNQELSVTFEYNGLHNDSWYIDFVSSKEILANDKYSLSVVDRIVYQ
jgi:hypothetical protein